MASKRICAVDGCDKGGHIRLGLCAKHYRRFKIHGDPLKTLAPHECRKAGRKVGWRREEVNSDWLRNAYLVEGRPVGQIAREIGYSVGHVRTLVADLGITPRDGRSGRISESARVQFNVAQAAWLYEIRRMSCIDIGAELGVNGSTILRRLREAGIRIRHHNDTKRGAKNHRRSKIKETAVVALYWTDGQTVDTVAERFGVRRSVILRILHERGVPLKRLSIVRPVTGDKNPNWRSDLPPEERAKRRDMYKQANWRQKVYERDVFTCQKCGDDKGGNLNAHHIEAHAACKEKRWSVDNGITLCAPCHRSFHRKYGLKRVNRAMLKEYLAAP